MKISLDEALSALNKIHRKACWRMKEGTEKHGTEMVKDPVEELEEELADSFNYITLGYLKAMSAIRRIERGTKRKDSLDLRINERIREIDKGTFDPKGL